MIRHSGTGEFPQSDQLQSMTVKTAMDAVDEKGRVEGAPLAFRWLPSDAEG
jgi:hypothetical protein